MSIDNAEIAKLEVAEGDIILVRVQQLLQPQARLINDIMNGMGFAGRYIIIDDRMDISTMNRDDWIAYTKKFFPGLLP